MTSTAGPPPFRGGGSRRSCRRFGRATERVGIARARDHDPDVLVFDEAASALDGATERAVFDAIRALTGHKTILSIAHRLATIQDADTIFVLDGGRIVARGPYDAVYAESDVFRRMAEGGGATARP